MKKVTPFLIAMCLRFNTFAQTKKDVITLVTKSKERKVEVLVDGKPFTDYIFPSDSILKKPVLYPIRTSKGTLITRGWPLDPRTGERTDHPHHVGLWLNYEDVNGYDYWNNSMAISKENRAKKHGTILHTGIVEAKSGQGKAQLTVTADWIDSDGKGHNALKEKTTYIFRSKGNQRIIDRITTLTAQDKEVLFKDVKDGMIAMRVARQLELPSDKPDVFTDANGVATKVPKLDNTGITGNYHSSEGVEGEKVWSTRGKWVNLTGKIGDEDISIAMLDHPRNISYPTYWHARGYGLFAANPLGAKVFSNGKDERNLKLAPKESVTFKYRVVITSGKVTDAELNTLEEDFAKMK